MRMSLRVLRSSMLCAYLGLAFGSPTIADERPIPIEGADVGLKEGWTQVFQIPAWKSPTGETILRSASVTLWVEQGWLSARRQDDQGSTEWQVALAQTTKDTLPVVTIDEPISGFELNYGRYFVREDVGQLRLMRQKKLIDSSGWPRMEMQDPSARKIGMATWREKSVRIEGWQFNDWCWATCGPSEDNYDVWVRLEHKELRTNGNGFNAGPRPAHMFYGDKRLTDEGDLLCAERSLAEFAEKVLTRKNIVKHFSENPAPAIVASEWLNSPETSLDNFRDRVVLLDFWGTWCGPCVANLPKIQALHEKYKDKGLVVIGVHSQQGADNVAAFLKERGISFPIAVDAGETFENYAIESVPAYFLIDKSGKSPWGFSNKPPTEEQIEKLLD